jgi:hypothetical protein
MKGEAKPEEQAGAQETADVAPFPQAVEGEPGGHGPGREDEGLWLHE